MHLKAALSIVLLMAGSVAAQTLTFSPPSVTDWFCNIAPRTFIVTVTNQTAQTVAVNRLGGVEIDFPEHDWLTVAAKPFSLGPGQSGQIQIVASTGGTWYTPSPIDGYVYLLTNLASPDDSLTIPFTDMTISLCDPPDTPPDDTLATACTRLAAGVNAEAGRAGRGGVNLDYLGSGLECDPTSSVYLVSGAPIVVHKVGTEYRLNSSLYNPGTSREFAIDLASSYGPISGSGYVGYRSATLITDDSAVGLIKTFYAPQVADTCNFIVQETKIFNRTGAALTGVTCGELADFDVPSDYGPGNMSALNWTMDKHFIYQIGVDSGSTGCQADFNRFGALIFLGSYRNSEILPNCEWNKQPYGTRSVLYDSIVNNLDAEPAPDGGFFWGNMSMSGSYWLSSIHDAVTLMTYAYDATLASNDTLYVYTAVASVRNGTAHDLEVAFDGARSFALNVLNPACGSYWTTCCIGPRGNIDGDPSDAMDVGDITALIDNLFINFTSVPCPVEADFNGDGNVDIADLTSWIDCLFISFCWWDPGGLPMCPHE